MAQKNTKSIQVLNEPSDSGGNFDSQAQDIRPFRLVKYFSFTGFIAILVFTLLISLLISYQAKGILIKKSENYARLVAENLNHQVFLQFVVPVARLYGRIRLRDENQHRRMDAVVRNTIHGFQIHQVNIYDLDGQIIFSTEKRLIEKMGQDSQPYKDSLEGETTSTLITHPGRLGGFKQVKMLQTFSPFRAEKPIVGSVGYVMGVFEIYQDLTPDYSEIAKFQYLSVGISLLLIFILFFVLRVILARADAIIEERNSERRNMQEKLHQSEKMAGLGQMIAAVSHEIRNPLGIISSTAEIINSKLIKYEPENQLANVIVDESQRLNEIVTEFLDFARPQIPKFANMSLMEVLDKNLTLLAPEIDKKNIRIVRRYGGPTFIQADPDLLYRAFLNIFLNAIQAMPDNGEINIKTTGINNGDGHRALVVISDNGNGIDTQQINNIFDPFFTTKNKGSGLGLTIVKNIIDAHNGSIAISNLEAGGTEVIIELPVKR